MEQVVFWTIWGALALVMGIYYLRRTHTIRSILRGCLTGLVALLLIHYFGHWIGFAPEISIFNFMQAMVLGVPGVVLMTVLHFIL